MRFASAVEVILGTNVVQGRRRPTSTLIEWVDYQAGRNGMFQRSWSTVVDEVNQLDLFSEPEGGCRPSTTPAG